MKHIIGVISAVCGERVSHSDALIVIILHVLILDSGLMAKSIILPKNKVDIRSSLCRSVSCMPQ